MFPPTIHKRKNLPGFESEDMKTEMFPPEIKPARVGWYETITVWPRTMLGPENIEGFSYWDGKRWSIQAPDPRINSIDYYHWVQDKAWRGLKNEH